MEREKLLELIDKHIKWIRAEEGGERANLRDADLSDANLRDADLSDADLRGANLRDANLRDADLRGANLSDADLSDANLRDADLRGANLRDADLRGANLRDANLRDADLRDANLAYAFASNIKGKNLYQVAGGIGECGRSLTVLCEKNVLKWWIGCFSGSTQELLDEINKRHAENKLARETCLDAVEYLKKICKHHGWKEDARKEND